jgi:ABC-type cobalamin/Fe3+-siderophores transport system ATPase subunit
MVTKFRVRNYRSFVDAEAKLAPFTLLIGANGSGKSNLLKFFQATTYQFRWVVDEKNPSRALENVVSLRANPRSEHPHKNKSLPETLWPKHRQEETNVKGFSLTIDGEEYEYTTGDDPHDYDFRVNQLLPWHRRWPTLWNPKERNAHSFQFPQDNIDLAAPIYKPQPGKIAQFETTSISPIVETDGSGTCATLDYLKTSEHEEKFNKLEMLLKKYIPEVEKLSLKPGDNKKQIQVTEKTGLTFPAQDLSDGTLIIISLLTILHQVNKPPFLLLEDLDRALHPRLLERFVPLIQRIAENSGTNIIATTHNPIVVDFFGDNTQGVLIVEKINGESRVRCLQDILNEKGIDLEDSDDRKPLGTLWYSGLLGGVPRL